VNTQPKARKNAPKIGRKTLPTTSATFAMPQPRLRNGKTSLAGNNSTPTSGSRNVSTLGSTKTKRTAREQQIQTKTNTEHLS
jgi:hypothetical protein